MITAQALDPPKQNAKAAPARLTHLNIVPRAQPHPHLITKKVFCYPPILDTGGVRAHVKKTRLAVGIVGSFPRIKTDCGI
jgi:hypothetical protein